MTPGYLQPIANHLWQSTLFAGVAGLLTLALRKNAAHTRYWLWLAASVKFLVPFSILVMVGGQFGRTAPAPTAPAITFAIEQVSQPFSASVHGAIAGAAPSSSSSVIPGALYAVWAIGFVFVVFSCWRRSRSVWAALRAASPLDLPLGIRVMSSPAILEPGVFGVRRPVLLLPEGITSHLTALELEAILAHELCHVRRRDNLAAIAHMAVEALFWFHPLVWWLGARLMEEREHACDEDVLRKGSDPHVYAAGILKICELYLASPLPCASGVTGSNLNRRIEAIMSNRIALRLNFIKKFALTVAGVAVLVAPIIVGIMNTPATRAQSRQSEIPSFEVASVKPAAPSSGGRVRSSMRGGPGTTDADRIIFTNVTLMSVLLRAYDVKSYQTAGPAWLASERYDITATIPAGATRQQFNLMLQRLLADRFHLALHHETRELHGYELVKGKTVLKLKQSTEAGPDVEPTEAPKTDANGFPQLSAPGLVIMEGVRGKAVVSFLTAKAQPLSALAELFSKEFRMPVEDKTGLTGKFDFTLEFAPEAPGALPSDAPEESAAPNLISAVPRQLGLKLEPKTIPVDILIIERADKIPTEN
jgi:bla regulator protein blaR1